MFYCHNCRKDMPDIKEHYALHHKLEEDMKVTQHGVTLTYRYSPLNGVETDKLKVNKE